MKWFLEETVYPYSKKIQHGDSVLLLGSCFSENIFEKARISGLNFLNTRFGTLFHPLAIAKTITDAINQPTENRILERDGRFYSWDAYTKFHFQSEKELFSELQAERVKILSFLNSSNFLFITFGSAKSYKKDGELVANCHKVPGNQFTSELCSVEEMVMVYRKLVIELKNLNPTLEIILTVSPVRHSKEGLVTNNRSKARLLMLCEELEKLENVNYFPAYEMVMDELRDYRFYSSDLVHPNNLAVDYVWEKFQDVFLSDKTKQLSLEIIKKRNYFDHRPTAEESEKEKQIRKIKEDELANFLKTHPEIVWK